tara:strand:+ start:176 stop:595 length:420 start_codon:yes stop_codon:yes gene_type:complete
MKRNFKILKIDHIAIAVDNINTSKTLFDLLGMNFSKLEEVDSENVNVLKIHSKNNDHTIELLEPKNDNSVVKKFLNAKGQGMHHIALEVDNINNAILYLKSNNISLVYETPQIGADEKMITFIHPKDTSGVLIELCQKP